MTKEQEKFLERAWYMGFCNNNEIDRILSPKNSCDYLLSQRANIVADNPRYYRVYLRKSEVMPNWSFENSFATSHYTDVINNLSDEDKTLCSKITYGDIFSDDANGYAEKNEDWGRIIYLNECLQFYMKFCNLALFDFDVDVPDYVRLNSLRIAIRTMMKMESMDFFLDPRGKVPESVGNMIHYPIKHELQFIAGHEFSHHLCKHFDDKSTVKRAVLSFEDKKYIKPVYSVSQKQEFEADLSSINRPLYSKEEYDEVLKGALIWFVSLSLVETAQEIIVPTSNMTIKTHPSAKDRFYNLVNNAHFSNEFNTDFIDNILKRSYVLRIWLNEDLAENYDIYDFYGSIYLDKPNTMWRGRELVDRVDY